MRHAITLNVGPDLCNDDWNAVAHIYRTMHGWIEGTPVPCWYGRESDVRWINASAEPGGLLFEGKLEPHLWTGWMTVICARLTMALGKPVHDVGM